MNTVLNTSLRGSFLNAVFSLLLLTAVLMGAAPKAEGATTRLYLVGNTPAVSISGAAGTTNLAIGNSADLSDTNPAADTSYVTTLSATAPGGSDTITHMRESYTVRRPATPYYLLGTAYLNTGFATDATIAANTTGSFNIKSSNNSDRFLFRLIDYNPANGVETVIGKCADQSAVAGTITQKNVTFDNNSAYNLPAGHYLAVEVRYYPREINLTGYVYCNSNKQSFVDVGIQFPVTASATINGQVSAPGTTTATSLNSPVITQLDYNSSKVYTVTASGGYIINSVSVDGVPQAAAAGLTAWPYTFSNINRSHTISANFVGSINTFTITPSAGGHITVDCCPNDWIGPGTYTYGLVTGTYVFTATPYAGYSIGEVYVNGSAQGVPGGQTTPYTVTLTLPASTSLAVEFIPFIDVTASVSGVGGTISPAGTTSVPQGQPITFDIVPDNGYRILSITDNGVNVGNTSPYTITNVTDPHAVIATFRKVYTIDASAGPNGTISPIGSVLVDSGIDRNFSLSSNFGYKVGDVLVDGTSVGAMTSYTFANVSAEHTISVSFTEAPIPNTYCAIPPFITTAAPPNVMLMLSVESPMEGAANPSVTCTGTPSSLTYSCSSSGLGAYDNTREYYGYFEPGKCYTYTGSGATGLFSPSSAASNHQCPTGTAWSGNMLNWSTTLAVDAFRKAFTGGNRTVDTSSDTVLLAATNDGSWFPVNPTINNAELYMPVAGTNVTRTIVRQGAGIGFGVCNAGQTSCTVGRSATSGEVQWPTAGTNTAAVYSLRIKACSTVGGTETRCNSTTNKPEGTIQKYMDKMRFSLFSYAADNGAGRDGGVLRAAMKWVSPKIGYGLNYHDATGTVVTCTTIGGCANPEREVETDGTFRAKPDDTGSSYNSGVINYINKFSYTSGYKGLDPMGELYYEVVRYFKNLTPSVNNYCSGLTVAANGDGFNFYCDATKTNKWGWRDPAIYPCSQNFVIAVNDANPWLDKRIPGSAFKADYTGSGIAINGANDYCGTGASACDTDFLDGTVQVNVESWTNLVGDYEGLTGTTMNVACEVDSSGVCIGGNSGGKNVTINKLGRIIGTPPYPAKENSYNVSGLAYYAHMTDLRPDLAGNNNLTTYMIDTQEPAGSMLVGPKNMLFLAAKYGGFGDKDSDGKPYKNASCGGVSASPDNLCSEWDANNDGYPDNYFFASDASRVENGLNTAFNSILNHASSGTAAAVANNKSGERGANMIQALFYPEWPNDKNIKWLGEVQALWYYLDPVINYSTIREDSDSDKELDLTKDLVPGTDPFVTKALWKAGVELHKRAASDRHIYSLLSATKDLTNSANSFSTAQRAILKPQLNASSFTDTQTDNLINYLRGTDSGSYRSRTVTNGALTACWKLGDVINSTPQVQSAVPTNAYHQIYTDYSYSTFIGSNQYKTNNVVYSGANDGMLHAFRLGQVQKIVDSTKPFRIAGIVGDTNELGKEEWAFIPQNALPYLQNQADQNYCHQYMVDGAPLVVDASINNHCHGDDSGNYWECPRQTTLVGGAGADKNNFVAATTSWKSVLIGSMGLGGASRDGNCNETLNHDTDATNNMDCMKTPVTNSGFSSYFALDVTDPLAPKHMWEFSDANLPADDKGIGLTTPGVAIVRINTKINGAIDKTKNGRWFGVFASGPTGTINTATRQFLGRSDQNLKIYIVDLNPFKNGTTTFIKGTNYWVKEPTTPIKYAFANSMSGAAVDLDRSSSTLGGYYSDDVVYITYTKASLDSTSPPQFPVDWNKGGVLRLVTNNDPDPANWFVSTLVDDIGPVTTSIGKLQDRSNKKLWVYFGEGRYFYQGDELVESRRIFGIADPCYNYDLEHINTLSTTAANCPAVPVDGTNLDTNLENQSNTISESLPVGKRGWYITLDGASGTSGAERVVSDVTAATNGIVFYTTFIPNSDICTAGGNTSLWAVKYNTGGIPPSGGLKGKAPLQTSSGGISMIDLQGDPGYPTFSQRGGRKLRSSLSPTGQASKKGFTPLLQPKPTKQILNIQER